MALSVFIAELRTILETNISAEQLRQALMRGAPASRSFGWIGDAPRVTRRSDGGRFSTTVVWVGAWPPDTTNFGPPMRGVAEATVEGIARELNAIESGWAVSARPYNPTTNGSLDWWRRGTAAQTRTRDEFPTLAGRFGELDNPIGPTTPETRPQTAGEIVRDRIGQATGDVREAADRARKTSESIGDTLVIAGIVLVPLAIAWGISSFRGIVREARENPRRKRRR